MKNNEYWIKRAEENILRAEQSADKQIKLLTDLWERAIEEIDAEITRFYYKYIGDDKSELNNVLGVLNQDDVKAYNQKAKKYYQQAKKENWQESYQSKLLNQSTKKKIKRIEELKLAIYHIIQEVYEKEHIILTDGLIELYKESYSKSMYDTQTGLNIGAEFDIPNEETIKQVIKTNWVGSNYSDRIWTDKARLISVLEQELLRGFATGENPRKIATRVSHKTGVSQSNAERLIRTEFIHVANESSFNTVQALNKLLGGEVFDKYKIIATLDSRTSNICQEMDLKEFYFKDKVTGVNYPPLHPNCRSTYKLVFNGQTIAERIAKRLDTGAIEYIPATISYKEWAKKFEKTLDKN